MSIESQLVALDRAFDLGELPQDRSKLVGVGHEVAIAAVLMGFEICSQTEDWHAHGNGYGSGYGFGFGNGRGYGSGNGDGDGAT